MALPRSYRTTSSALYGTPVARSWSPLTCESDPDYLPTRRGLEGAEDIFDTLFGVAEEHLGVVAEEERVLDAGVAGGH